MKEELLGWELDLIERICGDHRFHDLTVLVLEKGHLALVHKPSEPPGAFWAPAGGLEFGEDMAQGVRREVLEETGLVVEVRRYLLRAETQFRSGDRSRPWTSHVFLARPARPADVHGALSPRDKKEVETAAWVSLEEFASSTAPILSQTGWGRFRYRLALANLAFAELGWAPLDDAPAPV